MYPVKDEITKVLTALPEGVRLCAISKYHPAEYIEAAYECGQRVFGESHVQELQQKQSVLPGDIEWHFIGHLQTNKVKYIAPYISMIQSVDSERLLREINKQAQKNRRRISCLLELHIAEEDTKSGLSVEECRQLVASGILDELPGVQICGLMMMASNVDDDEQIAAEFHKAHELFLELKQDYFAHDPAFKECSWGMSDDYPLAIANGSTMIRIGTKIFGPRVY